MKGLIKYFCFVTTVAGITAPVTYFTTKEDIKKNEKFKGALAERQKQEENINNLGREVKEKEAKVTELKGCVDKAKGLKDSNSIRKLKEECSKK